MKLLLTVLLHVQDVFDSLTLFVDTHNDEVLAVDSLTLVVDTLAVVVAAAVVAVAAVWSEN